MKKHVYLLLALAIILSLILVACGTRTTTTPAQTTTTSPTSTTTTSQPPTTTTSSRPTSSTTTSTAPTTATTGTTPTSTTTRPPTSTSTTIAPSPTSGPTATGNQQRGGILKLIAFGGPLNLGDPVLLTDANSIMGVIPVLEPLLLSDNSGAIHPALATDWKFSDDGKTLTLTLRKGVKFHDGTDFNAQAAKWNLDRQVAAKASGTVNWTSIDVVDDYTIKIGLKAYQNTVLYNLEGGVAWMISPTAAQKNGDDWIKLNPVGTGPFKFKSFVRDVSLEYTKFDNYWDKGKPYLDGIQFTYIADATTAQLAFQSGVGDVLTSATDVVTNDLIKRGYNLEKRPGPLMSLVPDSKHTDNPLSNVKVRQAISYAVDRNAVSNTLGYGLWEVATQPSAAFQFGHLDNVPYNYNPTKAKQLLAEAGYPNGFKTTIITSSTFSREPLLAAQGYLAAVGIKVDLNIVEFASWNNLVTKGWDNAMMYVTQGATQTNYVSFLSLYYAATATRYPVLQKPAGLTDLVDQALLARDFDTQKKLAQQAARLIVDDSTTIPLWILSASYVLKDNVHDTNFSSLAGAGFRWNPQDAWLSK